MSKHSGDCTWEVHADEKHGSVISCVNAIELPFICLFIGKAAIVILVILAPLDLPVRGVAVLQELMDPLKIYILG